MTVLRDQIDKILRGEVPPPAAAALIGFRLTRVDADAARFEMDADVTKHANPMGTLHGGILCDIADAAMGVAYASRLNDGESFTTLELKINFLKPVWNGHLVAEARVVKRGRTVGLVQCDITDDTGSLVARATCTCMTLRDDMARGR